MKSKNCPPFVKGQAHDVFSRIFQIRIYIFFLPNTIKYLFIFSQMIKTEKKCLFCPISTGKSFSEALLFAEHGENILNVRNNFCTQRGLPRFELGIFMYWTCNSMNNLSSYCGLSSWCKNKSFWQRFTCTFIRIPSHDMRLRISCKDLLR